MDPGVAVGQERPVEEAPACLLPHIGAIRIGVSGVLLEGFYWPVDPWVDSDRRPGDIPGMLTSAFRISRMSPGAVPWGGLLVPTARPRVASVLATAYPGFRIRQNEEYRISGGHHGQNLGCTLHSDGSIEPVF